ncbi:MAG TPA: asparaginase [Polyangiaceae bacterium]|nr:asparaginase [Polyangiaceae bacterium]
MHFTRKSTVYVTRGDGLDAVHEVAVAVIDERGHLLRAGDPEAVVFARSSLKPFQALALFPSGAARQFELSQEELAIACASHSGSDRHVAVVQGLLGKIGASAGDLGCGVQWPIGMRLENRYPSEGEDSDPLRHNCSGKHAGFLAVARALEQPLAAYLEPESKVQTLVRAVLASACEIDENLLGSGVDGCSAPNYALPLRVLAQAAKRLASADASESCAGLAAVRRAMLTHPLLVSGPGRFDYQLTCAFPDNLVCKAGAEAIQLIGFEDPPLGIAVKVLDGAERALAPAVMAVLRRLGLSADRLPQLSERVRPAVTNARGIVTGELIASIDLET